jgi:hypothetical protein
MKKKGKLPVKPDVMIVMPGMGKGMPMKDKGKGKGKKPC